MRKRDVSFIFIFHLTRLLPFSLALLPPALLDFPRSSPFVTMNHERYRLLLILSALSSCCICPRFYFLPLMSVCFSYCYDLFICTSVYLVYLRINCCHLRYYTNLLLLCCVFLSEIIDSLCVSLHILLSSLSKPYTA